jgi:ABC-2 type transport system ATP-binding protein
MIAVSGLTKRYGEERAVNDISFEVKQGEVLGFLGPNGAGKTTTMKVITCFLPPSEGTVYVDGLDVRSNSMAVRTKIGYLPEHTPLYHEMTVYDYLSFVASMRGVESKKLKSRISEMADVCGLPSVIGKRIEALSKGYRQRVGLAQAMIHKPPIVILDEPTTGLDPNQIVEIRELIQNIGVDRTVILSTHILSEVELSCDRVLIINRGELVADGTPKDLQAGFAGDQTIRFGVKSSPDPVAHVLANRDGIRIADTLTLPENETVFVLASNTAADVRPDLFRLAADEGWTLSELSRVTVNLEDVFRDLTTD